MKITPLDVRKQEFKKVMRGFDPHEIQAFLDMVAEEMEELIKENTGLTEKMRDLDTKVDDYRRMEKTLQDTLTSAQRTTDELRRNAEKEAELALMNASMKSEAMLEEARMKLSSLKSEIAALENAKMSFVARFKSLLESQLKILESEEKPLLKEERAEKKPKRVRIVEPPKLEEDAKGLASLFDK